MLLLFGALLSGCLTQKKREDVAHRYLRENPKVLADLAALHFPVVVRPGVPVLRPGVPVITYGVDTLYHKKDTVTIRVREYVHTVDTLTLTDTIPDHALAESLMLAKFEAERKLNRSEVELENERERSKQRLWWLIGAIAVVTGVLGFNIYGFLKPGIKI